MRYALTSAVAAATPPRSWSSAGSGAAAGCGAGRGALRRGAPFPSVWQHLDEPRSPGWLATSSLSPLSKSSPLGRDRLGVLEVLVEERPGVAGVQAVDVERAHDVLCSSTLEERTPRENGDRHPEDEGGGPTADGDRVQAAPAAADRARDEAEQDCAIESGTGRTASAITEMKIAAADM